MKPIKGERGGKYKWKEGFGGRGTDTAASVWWYVFKCQRSCACLAHLAVNPSDSDGRFRVLSAVDASRLGPRGLKNVLSAMKLKLDIVRCHHC